METIKNKTLTALLRIAEWQVGVAESPPGSNRVKYNAAFYGKEVSGAAYPWCMVFVWWCFREAGFNLRKTASCSALKSAYAAAGQWVTDGKYKRGDIVLFDFSGTRKKTEHCGIVIAVSTDGLTVTTVEGNTSDGSNADGGSVMRRKRSVRFITGACRPNFGSEV